MKIADVLTELDRLTPFQLAEPWDRVGLQVGSASADVSRLLVVLDVDEEALDQAARRGCQAILTHHPVIFQPLDAVTDAESSGALVARALREDVAVISAHTNLDKARGGLADVACALLGLEGVRPLEPAQAGWVKLVGFVPADELDTVRAAVFAAGAGVIGDYEHCSFALPGTGTFLPREGAHPTVGTVGADNTTDEVRLEVVVPRSARRAVLDAFVAAHSYEEPAYDVYPVEDELPTVGLGRVGYLERPLELGELAATVARVVHLPSVRVCGDQGRRVTRVAVLPGSGSTAIPAAAGVADVLITGDVKYHDADAAARLGLALIDVPHEVVEGLALERWTDRLGDALGVHGVAVEFLPRIERLWSSVSARTPQVPHLGVDDVGAEKSGNVFELFVDGGARGNPGPAGIGARLLGSDGEVTEELADYIGVATNNVAEYQALIAGLEMALDHGVRSLIVYADSELVVRQLNGQYKVKEPTLRVLYEQAQRLLRELPDVQIKHVPREQNVEADRLVNSAIDAARPRR